MLLMCKFYCCSLPLPFLHPTLLNPSSLLLLLHLSFSLSQPTMAVQAQNPSNVFLLTSGQESHDYSVQPHGVLFDHSHMIFNNGESTNSRRSENSNENRRLMIEAQNEPFWAQRSHSPPFLDLSQLKNLNHQPSTVVSTGLHLAHADQRQHQHRLWNFSRPLFLQSSDDFTFQLKQQKHEVDQLLQAHAEELRRELAGIRQRQYRELVRAAEKSLTMKLREKEAEVEKAKRKENELEARATQLKVEGQIWQAKARSQEAAAASLQAELHRAIKRCGDRENGAAVSGGCQPENAESVYADPNQVMTTGPRCRACKKKAAAVVLLPCRHLCLCRSCDQVVEACPLCFCFTNFSVEVNLS